VLLEFYPVSLLVQGDHAFDLGWLMVANINLSDNNVMVRDTWVVLPSVNNSGVVRDKEVQGVLLPCWLVDDLFVATIIKQV
jgi:hypothetical protein